MSRPSSRCGNTVLGGLLTLLIACALGLPDKYWCCPPDSTVGGRCILCHGSTCEQPSGGCPAGGLYYYESFCGRYTKCVGSAASRIYWHCPKVGNKCSPCMGEGGELPVAVGGCPRSGSYSSVSECETATVCAESGTSTPATTTARPHRMGWYCGDDQMGGSCRPCGYRDQRQCTEDKAIYLFQSTCETNCDGSPIYSPPAGTTTTGPIKTRWYCGSELSGGSCKPCGGSGQRRCPDDKILFPHRETCEIGTKCGGSPIHSKVKPQPSTPDTIWYCPPQSDDGKCSSCRGDYGQIPADEGGCPNMTYRHHKDEKSCQRLSSSWCFSSKKHKPYKRIGHSRQFCIFDGCNNYCEAETENKWYKSEPDSECKKSSFLDCCTEHERIIVHKTKKECEDYTETVN